MFMQGTKQDIILSQMCRNINKLRILLRREETRENPSLPISKQWAKRTMNKNNNNNNPTPMPHTSVPKLS